MGPHRSAPGAWSWPGSRPLSPLFPRRGIFTESGSCRTQPTSIAHISQRQRSSPPGGGPISSPPGGGHLRSKKSLPTRAMSWVCERGCRQAGQRCGEAGRGPQGAACWAAVSADSQIPGAHYKTEAKRVHVHACACACMCGTQGVSSGRERGGPARAETDSPSPPPFLPLGLGG